MSPYETVQSALSGVFTVGQEIDGVRVLTHCMYPSNGFVQVFVRGGISTFVVSDDGGALREIESAGIELPRPDKLLRPLIEKQGLHIRGGVIQSPHCHAEALPVAIAHVANASKEAADWLFANTKVKIERSFREMVAEYLRLHYDVQRVKSETVVGHSNKPHKFDNLITLPSGGRLIVDAVVPEASSINARVVANMDVKAMNHHGLEQRIVYDDDDEWRAEDLNLLSAAATVMPFARATEYLGRVFHA